MIGDELSWVLFLFLFASVVFLGGVGTEDWSSTLVVGLLCDAVNDIEECSVD